MLAASRSRSSAAVASVSSGSARVQPIASSHL